MSKDGSLQQSYETPFELSWINRQQLVPSGRMFTSVVFDPTKSSQTPITDLRTNTFIEKAVSNNKKCALYHDPSLASPLFVFDFVTKLYNEPIHSINPSFLTGIDLATAKFEIGDNCLNTRINNKIFHMNPEKLEFVQDSLPTSMPTLLNPVLTPDF
jgi:hypothetical protein